MKIIFLFSMILFFSLNANLSMGQSHEIKKLDKDVELLLDSAAKHMVSFILTQKEAEYDRDCVEEEDARRQRRGHGRLHRHRPRQHAHGQRNLAARRRRTQDRIRSPGHRRRHHAGAGSAQHTQASETGPID